MNIPAIDAHQHFWQYEPQKHSWINDEMAVIRNDFMPTDLFPELVANKVEGCVAVQADQTEAETTFLCNLAKQHPFIRGVVGWTDLRADTISEQLEEYATEPIVKGFRHVLQGEAPEFMLQPSFLDGIAQLDSFGFTYDILIFPQHLEAALTLVKTFPNQPFVIDHIAKPFIKTGEISNWQKGIERIAQHENVHCKISGMVTETDYHNWKPADFTPYLDVVVNAFGTNRLMYGSDWPVCKVAATYEQVIGIAKHYFSTFSVAEQTAIFRDNAVRFYNL